jgi:hypothetical protein
MLKNDTLVRNYEKRASRVVIYVSHYFGKRFPRGQIWSPFFQVLTLWYAYIKRRGKQGCHNHEKHFAGEWPPDVVSRIQIFR